MEQPLPKSSKYLLVTAAFFLLIVTGASFSLQNSPLLFSLLVLLATLGAAAVGFLLHGVRPFVDQSDEHRSAVRLAMGLMATLTAVVLGMVTSSAKDTFDQANDLVSGLAVDVITLDKVLDSYGPETEAIRQQLLDDLRFRIERLKAPETYAEADLAEVTLVPRVEMLYGAVVALEPASDLQKALQARALDMIGGRVGFGEGNMAQKRWLFTVRPASVPSVFLAVVLIWLVLEFLCFGLFSPRRGSVYVAILVAAVVLASAMFLLLELEDPIDGFFKVSVEPLQRAEILLNR